MIHSATWIAIEGRVIRDAQTNIYQIRLGDSHLKKI
jgi:hypothetical protein